jgi:opacity protein-like surface antigen
MEGIMSTRILFGCIIAASSLTLASAATAQKFTAVQDLGQLNLPSLAQRIGALEQKNGELQSEVLQLQQQLAQAKAAEGNDVFKDRFRITALELNQKQGGTAAQLGQQLADVSTRVGGLEGKVTLLNSSLVSLTNKFATHTHTYDKTTFGWANHQMQNIKMAEPTLTSPPQTYVFDSPQH